MLKRKVKSNPSDYNFLNQLVIIKSKSLSPKSKNKIKNIEMIQYLIFYKNELIGEVDIEKGTNFIASIEILEQFQRKGIASYVYDYIEDDLKIKLKPSTPLLDDGKAFWKNRKLTR